MFVLHSYSASRLPSPEITTSIVVVGQNRASKFAGVVLRPEGVSSVENAVALYHIDV